ncbi:arginine-glutamic acid dipeptide repeats protein-like [Gorilla gorilla gorilla]|uniref:arginine-glutamic acid dipeptide repeats protein-like n=1 Tax=Gorilla gorilla gorilla TaxID=9595 RepID=UPI0030097DB8
MSAGILKRVWNSRTVDHYTRSLRGMKSVKNEGPTARAEVTGPPLVTPRGELEGEEQRAAERHGPAEQLGPLARHEGDATQPATEPARRGRCGRGRARAEAVGARGAAAAPSLVLGVLAAAAAAAAASAFRHYMLPVAGFIPPPPPRARRPGPARPVAPQSRNSPHPLTRTLHVSRAPPPRGPPHLTSQSTQLRPRLTKSGRAPTPPKSPPPTGHALHPK